MKKFTAEIDVMPLKALLDPQGKAVGHGLKNMGISSVDNIRIGKHISLEIEASGKDEATKKVDEACKKLLANPVMESYHFTLTEA
ncbi:MAG TPA: phosphoribosylformylglycinamidine synthase subunit PurS [Bacteroidia bacterium]|nr:phosphoribosylformylglycinamidine synthase subunit PurS [Bacteroidia bacterium]HNS12033.1 phosphoribosylformylglycinamidine synthase subunit PurS [Bacteroidia bacterium]